MISKEMLIHIGAEIIIVGGIAFYFYTQNKKLSERVKELEYSVKDFQEQSMKQQKQINLINKKLSNLKSTQVYNSEPVKATVSSTQQPIVENIQIGVTTIKKPDSTSSSNLPRVTEMFDTDNESDEESIDEEDLDYELAEELKDLEEVGLSTFDLD